MSSVLAGSERENPLDSSANDVFALESIPASKRLRIEDDKTSLITTAAPDVLAEVRRSSSCSHILLMQPSY